VQSRFCCDLSEPRWKVCRLHLGWWMLVCCLERLVMWKGWNWIDEGLVLP